MEPYTDITAQELRQKKEKDPDLLVVDLREAAQYQQSHIDGAVSFPMAPTFWSKLFKRRSLKKLLGPDYNRSITFY